MSRILITGGAGFIGSHLVDRLLPLGHDVTVLDHFGRNSVSKEDLMKKHVTVIQGDVTDRFCVAMAMDNIDVVVHMASVAGVDTVMKNPVRTMETALYGTLNVLKQTHFHKGYINRLINFSTSEVFGEFAHHVKEGDSTNMGAVGEARWTYAVAKLAMEHLVHNYHVEFKIPTVSIRPFNIFGPGQVGEGAVHQFIVRALKGEPLEIHNDGDQIRAWCYVDDLIDGVMACLDKPAAIGQSFNLGNPRNTLTTYSLAKEIVRLSGSKSEIVFKKNEYQDVEVRVPNIEKAKQFLGYDPKNSMEEGLIKTIGWYMSKMV